MEAFSTLLPPQLPHHYPQLHSRRSVDASVGPTGSSRSVPLNTTRKLFRAPTLLPRVPFLMQKACMLDSASSAGWTRCDPVCKQKPCDIHASPRSPLCSGKSLVGPECADLSLVQRPLQTPTVMREKGASRNLHPQECPALGSSPHAHPVLMLENKDWKCALRPPASRAGRRKSQGAKPGWGAVSGEWQMTQGGGVIWRGWAHRTKTGVVDGRRGGEVTQGLGGGRRLQGRGAQGGSVPGWDPPKATGPSWQVVWAKKSREGDSVFPEPGLGGGHRALRGRQTLVPG